MHLTIGEILPYIIAIGSVIGFIAKTMTDANKIKELIITNKRKDNEIEKQKKDFEKQKEDNEKWFHKQHERMEISYNNLMNVIVEQHKLNEELLSVAHELTTKNEMEHDAIQDKISELRKEHQKLSLTVAEVSLELKKIKNK